MKMGKTVFLVVLFVSCSCFAAVAEELNYNLVQLSYSATQEVENDMMVVTLRAFGEGKSANEVADKVNSKMQWALEKLKNVSDIKKETTGYETYPRYKSKVIVGWQADQQLRLESKNIKALTNLVGVLQQRLEVENMQFSVSSERRKDIAEKLMVEALQGFYQKAGVIAKTVGGKDFRMTKIEIHDAGGPNYYRSKGVRAEMALLSAPASAPAVETGETVLKVTVAGTIQVVL